MKKILITISVLLMATSAYATPVVDPVLTGSLSLAHKGGPYIVRGSFFGTKSPAAPRVWDNCENDTHGGSVTLNSPTAVRNFYTTIGGVWPAACTPDDYELNYRQHPYTNPYTGSRPMAGPHTHSNNYLAAGAYQDTLNCARNIHVGYYLGSQSNTWYASWYVRHDNNTWPTNEVCNGDQNNNIKVYLFQDGEDYGESESEYTYIACNDIDCFADYSDTESIPIGNYPCGGGYPDHYADAPGKSELLRWVRDEVIYRDIPGKLEEKKYDNSTIPNKTHDKNCNAGVSLLGHGTKAFFVGGFNRCELASGGYTHSGMWRYFDDIYIDTTWSRVMLCNNSSYDSATICEPQIPSGWADGAITFKANLGALNQSQAYLYVFDSTNTCNSTGYLVTLSDAVVTTTTSTATGTTTVSTTTSVPTTSSTSSSTSSVSTTSSSTTSTTTAPPVTGVGLSGCSMD